MSPLPALAALTSLDVGHNAFMAVPPALQTATALASLNLYSAVLRLGTADVEGLLASMPNLRRLHANMLPETEQHVQAIAPQLQLGFFLD